jgi:hypothetical protein
MRRVALTTALGISACGGSLAGPLGEPSYTGSVEAVDPTLGTRFPNSDRLLTKVLLRHEGDDCGLILAIWEGETTLQLADGRTATPADLAVGSAVDAWHTGLLLDSCPVQTEALAIRLVE